MRHLIWLVTALAVLASHSRLGVGANAEKDTDTQLASRAAVIGAEDTITISALEAEDLSKAWRVSNSGDISLPLIGRMHVAGLTIEQFEKQLAARMKRYYRDPQVSAYISDFRSQPVTIVGAVDKPGNIQLQGTRTLFDVLVQAGGPKEAGPTVTLTRLKEQGPIPWAATRTDDKRMIAELPMAEVMKGRGRAASIEIHPFDIVSVAPPLHQKLVHVAGEVARPGAVELITQGSVSISKIIAMAGGLTRTASAGRTMIVHINKDGVRTSSAYVDLNKIMSGRVKDIELGAGDLVIVPSSQVMAYFQAAGLSAVTTGVYLLGKL